MKIINSYAESFPTMVGVPVTLLAVLTCGALGEGDHNDTAVYVGTVNLGTDLSGAGYITAREKAAAWIAHNGVKQTLAQARRYFPNLTEESCHEIVSTSAVHRRRGCPLSRLESDRIDHAEDWGRPNGKGR